MRASASQRKPLIISLAVVVVAADVVAAFEGDGCGAGDSSSVGGALIFVGGLCYCAACGVNFGMKFQFLKLCKILKGVVVVLNVWYF